MQIDISDLFCYNTYVKIEGTHNWNGNYVGILEYDIGRIEPEDLTAKNGELYVAASQQGAAFFKINPKIKE